MRAVVVVPTYQEADNIVGFLRAVREEQPDLDIVVVDDNSPDGTGELAEKEAADLGNIRVIHRAVKDGLGNAYRQAFAEVLDAGEHDVIVQMDVDFSHDPTTIAALLRQIDAGADCVVGSRYVPGGATPNWPTHRRLLSRYGNLYTAAVLGLPVRDATSGFRAYQADALRAIKVGTTRSSGYAFMSEIAYRMTDQGLRFDEVPIIFRDRTHGTSKMSTKIIAESMVMVTRWGVAARLRRRKG